MSKTFTSKSAEHIASYPLVKSTTSFVFQFRLFAVLAAYILALVNFTFDYLLSNFPALKDYFIVFDQTFNDNVLATVDSLVGVADGYYKKSSEYASSTLKKFDEVIAENKKQSQETLSSIKKNASDKVSSYLKPVNEFASSSVDKVLPKSKKKAAEAKDEVENEISKSIEIVNDTIERSKDLILSKSSEISNSVLSTYNKEFDAASEKNYYVKVASASVHTGVTLLKNVNNDIIQPLKTSTQSYVSESVAQAEKKAENLTSKAKEYVASNGSAPVVSALA